jgi:hypothetical protein
VNSEPGTVPFAITFDQSGHLVIAETGTNALATFALSRNGTASLLNAAGTGQAATCWVTPAGAYLFADNAGSASVSGFMSPARNCSGVAMVVSCRRIVAMARSLIGTVAASLRDRGPGGPSPPRVRQSSP